MLRFWHHHGILGINARNLLYIKKLNKDAGIRFADDKMRTKQYLSARGVSTARLLGKITSETELLKFPWHTLPNDFVMKPNMGYGGEGIWVITQRQDGGWSDIHGDFVSQQQLEAHAKDILDGRYSISGGSDSVFFEQRLVCHPDFATLGAFGLPDIRVIVYNLVPVMAMVRVPTRESHGKANLHMGGLGLGVDLSKGEITHMTYRHRIITTHPDFGVLKGQKIPFWEDILLLATRIQQNVTLGYLAVDIVIDANIGPTLLEINARAGLGVQSANLAPLRDRLDRVAGVKVKTPEKGVRLAQDLFGQKLELRPPSGGGKPVIGLEEPMTLNLKHGTTTITARMNPAMSKNYLDAKLFEQMGDEKKEGKLTLGYTLQEQRGKSVFYPLEMTGKNHQVILGRKALGNFFLDVSKVHAHQKPPSPQLKPVLPADEREDPWRNVDNRIAELDRKLSLIAALRPLNAAQERERFFQSSLYEPQFIYRRPSQDLMSIKAELQTIEIDFQSPIGQLLEEKRKELIQKSDLLAVVGDDDHFPTLSEQLIPLPPNETIRLAEEALRDFVRPPREEKTLSADEVAQRFRDFLSQHGLPHWQVKLSEDIVSRCVIGKNDRLLLRAGELFSELDVQKLIAHEIETHIFCAENGKNQPYQILRRGTAGYLKTQEGLAVFQQGLVLPKSIFSALIGFHAVLWAREAGFREVFDRLTPWMSRPEAWRTTLKVKRGMTDTGRPGVFPKNAWYYWGYLEVVEYLQKGGLYQDLFLGKFHLSQLPLIRKIPGIREPIFRPSLKHPL